MKPSRFFKEITWYYIVLQSIPSKIYLLFSTRTNEHSAGIIFINIADK